MSELHKDLLSLTLLITLFFGAFLGTRPLTPPDEGRYAEIPREMVLEQDFLTPHINGIKYFEKPPLFYWLQSLSFKLLGENQWTVRLANAVIGLLGCLMTYFAGRELYNRRVGLLAAGILATSALYFGLARFVTLDMTLSVLLTGCLFSFLLARKKLLSHSSVVIPAKAGIQSYYKEHPSISRLDPGLRRDDNKYYFWTTYFFSALATLTKGFVGFLIPGAIIFLWLLFTNNWREIPRYRVLSGTLLFLIIAAPWHILVQLKHPEFFKFYILDQQFLRFFTPIADRGQAVWFLPAVLIGGFLPWSFFLTQSIYSQIKKRKDLNPNTLLLIIWPAVVFGLFWPSHSQLSPYILPMFPAMSLLVGIYFDNCIRENRNPSTGFIVNIAIFSLVAIIAWFNFPAPTLYLSFTVLSLALAGIGSFIIYKIKGLFPGILTLIILFSLFLISLNFSYPPTDDRTIKPLAQVLQPLLKENSTVATYHHYYQDLPFYIKQKVLVVDWLGELEFGTMHQNTEGLTIQDKDFWSLWQNKDQMFMIVNLKDLGRLQAQTRYKFVTIAQTQRDALVSNQEMSR